MLPVLVPAARMSGREGEKRRSRMAEGVRRCWRKVVLERGISLGQ